MNDIKNIASFYWDSSEKWCVEPGSGCTVDTGPIYGDGDVAVGTMIDCRIPEETRKKMALGLIPVTSYEDQK